eukprot:746888-Hanusia_phi.AAC.1
MSCRACRALPLRCPGSAAMELRRMAEEEDDVAMNASPTDNHAEFDLTGFSFRVPRLDLLAAALLYNDLTPEEGFEVFDIDCDGRIGLSEFLQTSQPLLGMMDEATHIQLFKAMDLDGVGSIERHNWIELLLGYDAAQVLTERGITPCVCERSEEEDTKSGSGQQQDKSGAAGEDVERCTEDGSAVVRKRGQDNDRSKDAG